MRFAEHQRRSEAWARERFTAEQIQALVYDEAGYPEWAAIEDLFRNWILDHSFTELDDSEIRAALFLIARSWDIGVIVAWLSDGPQLSNLGPLSEAEVLFLPCAATPAHAPDRPS